MSAYTPGPWRYQEESDAYTHIVRVGDQFLCQLWQDNSGESEANARLISKAPDLANHLQRLLALYDSHPDLDRPLSAEVEQEFEAVRSLLAQVEGSK